MSDEIWNNIFDGLYSVSNLGRVKSNDRQIVYSNGVVTTYKGKIFQIWDTFKIWACSLATISAECDKLNKKAIEKGVE